ncbi:hypothetical protein GIB67_036605 [Kingdonia uniflora]|uniref:Uncharacterized protein n=1 Tax=Kingdonia uniflora TaxID=39325 RepID=A0A7J7M0R1_9MAGN|nr:hypothetical protein GIB67_036605 [Kingdonia uniflora]
MVRTRSQRIRHAAEGRLAIKTAEVQEKICGSLGYDVELLMRVCQLEGLDIRSRELEYNASDILSGNDASVLESRMVRAMGNKGQPHEREKLSSSSSSPSYRFTTKYLESNKRERRKISGINQGFSEEDKWLKRAKSSGLRRWEYSSVVGRKLDSSADSCLDINCVKSTVEKKESLLDEVAEEKTKLELVLGELSLSRKKRVKSKSKKVAKAQSARSMMGVDEGTRQTSGGEIKKALPASGAAVNGEVAQGKRKRVEHLGGSGEKVAKVRFVSMDDLKEVEERAKLAILQGKEDMRQMVTHLVEGIWLGIEERESKLKNLQVEAKANLDEAVEERDRLGHHLILKGYSLEEVDAIKTDTYAKEEEEEAGLLGVVDGLDGVSLQTVRDNQGDDLELPEDGSEKEVKEMSPG